MNIAIISGGISSKSGLRVPIELSKALAAKGHTLFFYALSQNKDPNVIRDFKKIKISIRLIKKSNLLKQILNLRKKIKQDNPNIISAHCYASQLLAARLTGIPVIWTCRNDMLKHIHFDTRQFNHIVWDDADDLYKKLKNRIGAVI